VTTDGYQPGRAVIGPRHTATVVLEPTQPTLRRQLWTWADAGKYQAIIGWMLRPATTGYYLSQGSVINQGSGGDPMIAHSTTGYIGSAGVSVIIFIARPGIHWDTPHTPEISLDTPLHPGMLAGHRVWHGGPDNTRWFDTWWSYDPVSVIISGASQATADDAMTTIIKDMTATGPGR
jgi:hypothetical protein